MLEDGYFVYLLLYSDDILITAKNMSDIQVFKKQLSDEFKMKDLGAVKKVLGIEIQRDRPSKKVYLSKKGYIDKVLERFGMQNAKPVQTALTSHLILSILDSPHSEEDEKAMSQFSYSSVVGSMMYDMVCTHPDIAHAISVVSRYMADPGRLHYRAIKSILRYL